MDEIIDSRVYYEEVNNQTISPKEWQENVDLSPINLNAETNFEFNSCVKYHDEPFDQNGNLKNVEISEKINTVPSSDPLTEIKSSLFSDVRYYTINCADPFIDQILENNGANKESYLTTFITHVIYDKNGEDPNSNADFCEAKEVFDLTIVTSNWFRSCLKCECLLPTKPFLASNENRLFAQIKAINVNMSENLAKEIHALLSYNGAELIDTDTNDVKTLNCQPTHAFSVNFDSRSEKLDSKLKLITPDWVTDSIKQNTLLDEKMYHPKYLKSGESDNILEEAFKPTEIEANKTYQEHTCENSSSTKKFSKNLTLFTNNSDKINYLQSHANNFICEQNIQIESSSESRNPETNSSNSNTQNEQKSTYDAHVICVDVSTVHNETNGHHVTTPSKPKPTTPKKILTKKKNSPDTKASYSLNDSMNEIFDSVINKQASEEKEALENFGLNTNGLQPLQVDLIQPVQNSGKLNFDLDLDGEPAASNENKSDSIKNNEINSNLLYGCVFYTKANEEIYPKDCFDDWENVIAKFGGKLLNHISLDDSASVSQITHFICPNRFTKCFKKAAENGIKVATVYWLEDVLQEQVYRSPWLVYHFPSPYEHKAGPLKNHIFSSHGFTSKEKLFIFQVVWLLGGKYSSYLSNINSFLIAKNLKGPKVEKAKCWSIPVVNANWLMELYLGNTYALNKPIEERYKNIPTCDNYNHFAFDTSMVQDFMKHWKNDLPLGPPLAFKSNNSVNTKYSSKRSEFDEKVDQSPNKMKKVGLTWQRSQSNIPIVLFTGIESSRTAQFQRDVIGLGGIIAKQPRQATLLVVDKIDRTAKLLKCISTVENIVSIKWIIDSKLNGRFLDPSDYQVKDEWFENYYGCSLKDSLERAKRRPMFNGLIFYLSPSVRPSYQDLTDMINAAGGSVTNDIPTLPMIHEPFIDEFKTNLKSKYVIVGSQADLCILKPFIEKKIPIYSEEIILSGVLNQQNFRLLKYPAQGPLPLK
ncbi:PAX-interacting 1 [Brachionus plicatilis]|uniref:PAX-interacting protein 1 n=1 Tax=Brachionus plicatilis TaxID=10195 RepID=A0A3M7PMR4_BRAPC|nr:PAX-interacting 1 [Brachionus plicatilis]